METILELGPKTEENEVKTAPKLTNKLKSLKIVGEGGDDGVGGESSDGDMWYGWML